MLLKIFRHQKSPVIGGLLFGEVDGPDLVTESRHYEAANDSDWVECDACGNDESERVNSHDGSPGLCLMFSENLTRFKLPSELLQGFSVGRCIAATQALEIGDRWRAIYRSNFQRAFGTPETDMPDLQCVAQDFVSITRLNSASAADISAMASSSLLRVASPHKRSSSDLVPIFQTWALAWISDAISCAIRACFKRLFAARVADVVLGMVAPFWRVFRDDTKLGPNCITRHKVFVGIDREVDAATGDHSCKISRQVFETANFVVWPADFVVAQVIFATVDVTDVFTGIFRTREIGNFVVH